jgi:hypothetical protein
MTPPNKPEWIELADADSAPQSKKATRALPAFVLAAALSIIGVGALVAQSGTETPATATKQGVNVSATTSASAPSTTSPMTAAGSPGKSISASTPGAIANPSSPKQPGIASMPTGGGDDDEDDEDDEDEEGDDD